MLKKIISRKYIFVILTCILLISAFSFLVGCTSLSPTVQTSSTDSAQASVTTEAPTGFRALLANYGTWIWLAVLAVAFYFLLIRPQRVRSKKAQDLMSSLKRGDEIVTIGGFYGRIKDVREDSVIITIAGGVDVKLAKSAIARVITSQGTVDTQNKM